MLAARRVVTRLVALRATIHRMFIESGREVGAVWPSVSHVGRLPACEFRN
jgi:hypothetical protein